MATATPVESKSTNDVLKGIATGFSTLEAKVAAVEEKLKQPVGKGVSAGQLFSKRHEDDRGYSQGYYEASDEEVTLTFDPRSKAAGATRQSYSDLRRQHVKQLRDANYERWGGFKSASDFIKAGIRGTHTSNFIDKYSAHFKAIQGMSESVGADMGYTVMPEFSNKILDRVYTNELWGRTDNYTVTGNNMTFTANAETSRATGSRHGGLRGYWVPEGGSMTKSTPTVRQVSLKLNKLVVLVYFTEELLNDTGTALQEYVSRKASEEFNFLLGDSLINGTGAGQPLGLLNSPHLVSVAKETGQAAASLEPENIDKMYSRFFAQQINGAVWTHNQDVWPELASLQRATGVSGQLVYSPPGGMSSAPYATLMGRPLLPTEFNSTLGTQGDLILADFGDVLTISKGGVAQAVSLHVEFTTDQTVVKFVMRVDGRSWLNSPITPFKGTANTQSSAITLDTRS